MRTPLGYVQALVVDPGSRRARVGRALPEAFTAAACEHGTGWVFAAPEEAPGVAGRARWLSACGFTPVDDPGGLMLDRLLPAKALAGSPITRHAQEMSSAAVPEVYVDESGNSGTNLLDPNQPVFTLAGVHLPDDVAADIVSEVRSWLPATQGEPKYGSLARVGHGRKALLWAFAQLPPGSVRSYVVHKRFMVVTKMVDILVEPLAYATGFNLYEGKQALGLANMLYACGQALPSAGDQDAYDRLLQTFVDWMRHQATTDELFATLQAYEATVTDAETIEVVELVKACRAVADKAAADTASGKNKDSLNPAVTSLYCLGLNFGSTLQQFRLVHDASTVISHNANLLSTLHFLPDPAHPGQFLEQLPVTQIDFADSRDHPQLQLADWAAGATRQWATQIAKGGHNPFSEQLKPVVGPWLIDALWPSTHPEQE